MELYIQHFYEFSSLELILSATLLSLYIHRLNLLTDFGKTRFGKNSLNSL